MTPSQSGEGHEPQAPRPIPPEPEVPSTDASDFMQQMHGACRSYDLDSADGQQRLRDFLGQWSREERMKMAHRIMTDLMDGPTPARRKADAEAAARRAARKT